MVCQCPREFVGKRQLRAALVPQYAVKLILVRKQDLVMLAGERVKLLNYRCREREKKDEKIEEYQHLAREVRTKVAQALGT